MSQCYASLHSNLHEYLWIHDTGKAWHRVDFIFSILLSLLHGFDPYITFYLCCKYYAQWSVALRSAFNRYGKKRHAWGVFSFKHSFWSEQFEPMDHCLCLLNQWLFQNYKKKYVSKSCILVHTCAISVLRGNFTSDVLISI